MWCLWLHFTLFLINDDHGQFIFFIFFWYPNFRGFFSVEVNDALATEYVRGDYEGYMYTLL